MLSAIHEELARSARSSYWSYRKQAWYYNFLCLPSDWWNWFEYRSSCWSYRKQVRCYLFYLPSNRQISLNSELVLGVIEKNARCYNLFVYPTIGGIDPNAEAVVGVTSTTSTKELLLWRALCYVQTFQLHPNTCVHCFI